MGRVIECSPQEALFCRLRAEGFNQTDAFRLAFNKPDMSTKTANQSASRVAQKPQVLLTIRELFMAAKKSHLLSHAEWLSMMIDAFHESMAEGNKTAAASFGRLMGSGIGALNENLKITDSRLSNDQLLDRLAGQDPTLAAMLRNRLQARDAFDA